MNTIASPILGIGSAFLLSLLFAFLIVLDLPKLSRAIVGLANTKIGFIYDEVAENMANLAASVRETVSSIEEMAYSIKEVARNVDALSLTAEETSSSMNQMDVSIDQVQSNANETARLSAEVASDAEKGAEAILKIIKDRVGFDATIVEQG